MRGAHAVSRTTPDATLNRIGARRSSTLGLRELAAGERSVSDLSRCIGCQVPNMSQHLAVLRGAGIVASRREGSTVFYRLTERSILDAYRLLQQIAR